MAVQTLRTLESLIKYEKEKMQQLLQKHHAIGLERTILEDERHRTEASIKKENNFKGDISALMTLPDYIKIAHDQVRILSEKLQMTYQKEIQLKAELNTIYATIKTYEILKRMKKEGIEKLRLKKEQHALDEVGLHKFLFHKM